MAEEELGSRSCLRLLAAACCSRSSNAACVSSSCPTAAQNELAKDISTALVADEGGGAVAWAVGWMRPRGRLHIANLATHLCHRRRGHARALLSALLEQHR